MFLPELNHISHNLYTLAGFGGINRRETAEIGELAEAVNLSSDEYPLIMPRKRYDVGLFQKAALMWHNNDRDMALVPAVDPETVLYISDFINETADLVPGRYQMIYTGTESARYIIDSVPINCFPNQAFKFTVTESGVDPYSFDWAPSRIISTTHNKILPADIHYFEDPVCANIGTSTVISDKRNGMWVLEYNKDSDTYSYNKIQNKYEVVNETGGSTAVGYITGGHYCHLRLWFEDNTLVAGIQPALTEESLTRLMEEKENGKLKYVNQLIAYGEKPYRECTWYRLVSSGSLEPVDYLHYEFCTLKGSTMFNVGDYVELKMSGIWGRDPDLSEELAGLDGMYDVVKVRENEDGVKFSLFLRGEICKYGTINALIMDLGKVQKQGETTVNNKFLADGMTIERKAPENVSFICSHQNRIWCNNGNNEIMCCARGNPYVWYRYEGTALDSWAATIGGDGAFTGCINYGYPLFFKDNRMFRMTGTRPSNFGYDEYSMRGIKAGCHDSAVIVNDVLYYQSIDGVYAYASSTPVCVSDKVYKGSWQNGRACRFRDKYYLSVVKSDGSNTLYCYDTKSGIWHIEELNGAAVKYMYPGSYFHSHEDSMTVFTEYSSTEKNVGTAMGFVTGNVAPISRIDVSSLSEEIKQADYYAGYIMSTDDNYEYSPEGLVDWEFETTDLLASEMEYKYLKAVYINCRMMYEDVVGSNNSADVYIKYDGESAWKSLMHMGPYNGESRATWYKHIMEPRRCENIKLKFSGTGKAIIYRIILEFERGSADR